MSLARPAALVLLALASACASGPADGTVGTRPSREAMTATIDSLIAGGRFDSELWRLNLSERFGSAVMASRLTVDGDLLLVEDSESTIHAIDREQGAHRWFIDLDDPTTQVAGGTESTITFVATDDATAVSRSRGARLMGTDAAPRSSEHLDFFPSGRAVAVGDSLYVGRLAPMSLQAIDLTAGHAGWSYATSSPVIDSVVYGDGPIAQILSLTEDGLLFSLPPRAANESAWAPKENWYRRLAGTRAATPLALLGDHLVFGAANGFLYDVDARNGTVRFKVALDGSFGGQEATLTSDAAYQRVDDGVVAVELGGGNVLWTLPGAKRVVSRVGDRVYAELASGEIAVVAAATGAELARFPVAGLTLPTIQGGGMVIGSDGTNVFALK